MTNVRRLMHSAPIHAQPSKSRQPCYGEWYKLVNRVSSRNMTLKRGILPVVSGIAKLIHPSMDVGDGYLADFGKRLFVGLSQIVPRGEPLRPTAPEGRPNYCRKDFSTPSWSWISLSHKETEIWLSPRIMPDEVFNKYDSRCKTWGTNTVRRYRAQTRGNTYDEVKRVL